MDFAGNFRRIGIFRPGVLADRVLRADQLQWVKQISYATDETNQTPITATLPLIFDADFRHTNVTTHPAYDTYADELALLFRLLLKHYGTGHPVRVMFTNLFPYASIPTHQDKGDWVHLTHRIHIPIKTHRNVLFEVGVETRHLPQGEIWEINNHRPHSVHNKSPKDRLHLIVDWAANRL